MREVNDLLLIMLIDTEGISLYCRGHSLCFKKAILLQHAFLFIVRIADRKVWVFKY